MRTTFEKALNNFEDRSIDILHIDGLHTYEAVKSDFEMWKNKVRLGGTIIFHDWNVKKEDFGVWKLWGEIKSMENYKCLELKNGYGLGIATEVDRVPDWHEDFKIDKGNIVSKGKLLNKINLLKMENIKMAKQKLITDKHASNLEIIRDENQRYISSLEKEVERLKKKKAKGAMEKAKSYIKRIIHKKGLH